MFIFSAEIISKYSGKTYQEFVKERIFDQLNMTSTTFSVQEANSTGHLSQSWTYFQRRIPIILEDPTAANLVAGAGGILSNAVDMVGRSTYLPCYAVFDRYLRASGLLLCLIAESTPSRIGQSSQNPRTMRRLQLESFKRGMSQRTPQCPLSDMAWGGSETRSLAMM